MIEIDGSYLEGGGQITRTATALSAITGNPVRIINIRKGRPKPGLSAQHLSGIKAAAKLCSAETKGVELGSTKIEFYPKQIKGGNYKIDIGTAGSSALILQTLIPIAIHAPAPVQLEITGGTNVKWSMDYEYMKHIFGYYMKKMGIEYSIEIEKRGFYPKGGGKVVVKISPGKPMPLNLVNPGKFEKIDVHAIAENRLSAKQVAEREIKGFSTILNPDQKFLQYSKADCPGTSIHAHAHFENCKLGSSVIGEKNISAEQLGKTCATHLKKQIDSGACIDEWMADQILPYMALAVCNISAIQTSLRKNVCNISSPINLTKVAKINKKESNLHKFKSKISVAEVSKHCLTNAWIIEKFLPVKFNIKKEKNIIEAERLNK